LNSPTDLSCKQTGPGINLDRMFFPNHNQTSTLRTRTEMVFETLVFSLLNHLTQMIARENFIILSCWESNKSHHNFTCQSVWVWNLLSHSKGRI
jgi:hypothetical protein